MRHYDKELGEGNGYCSVSLYFDFDKDNKE
jgi:hypothetical protein